MRRLRLLPALLLMLHILSGLAGGQTATTTTVTADPGTITVGSTVGLTAIVQSNNAPSAGGTIPRPSGTITFLDGSTPLNSAPIALAPNGIASATFPQTFGTPDPTLTAQMISSVAGEVVGDLNGDGVQDMLIYNYVNDVSPHYSVQTFVSNGKAGYTASAVQTFSFPLNTGQYPYAVNYPQLIDLNGDGKLDLLCGLLVAHGNGDGTFAQAVPIPFLSSGFVTSYAADLNGDGRIDVLAVPGFPGDPPIGPIQLAVTVFINQGGGSFSQGRTFPVANPSSAPGVEFHPPVIVDLNDDGKPDLISLTLTYGFTQQDNPQRSVDVLLNNGDGTFGAYKPVSVPNPADYDGGPAAYGTGYGDVNGDGKPDLILTLTDTSADLDAMVLMGNGDDTFQAPLYLSLHSNTDAIGAPHYAAPSVLVQDLNLDGKQDLIFSDGLAALGNGDGTFILSPPLFPLQASAGPPAYLSFPLVQLTLSGSLVPSLVYLLPTVTPPAPSVFTPEAGNSVTLSLTTLAAGMHSITARYSGDANYTADSSAAVSVTVNQASSASTVTSSANPSVAGQSVTLTANITSPGPMPTGNVTFTSGSSTLGTVALSGGSAAYTTSFTTAGTQTITVSYSGDANTQASSTSISQMVNAAFSLAPGGSGSTTMTVQAGQTVSAPINLNRDTGFSGAVIFACSGLPTNASCSFSPASITVSGKAAVSTMLTVNTAASSMASQLRRGFSAYGLELAGLILLWPMRRRRSRIWAMLICVFTFAAFGLSGCSNGSGSTPAAHTAAGTYNFTVTASSGNAQTQSAYTLVVQ